MSLFDRLFPKPMPSLKEQGYFKLLNGYKPVFHSFNGMIYESELVRASIDAKARHVSKLKAEMLGSAHPMLQNTLKKAPNGWQTWSQFLYRLATILEVKNTAFIVPVLNDAGETIGIYPIAPERWELVEFGTQKRVFIKFIFENKDTSAIELEKVGILTKFQYKSDFFGTSNKALSNTMDLIEIQNQGITEGVKSAASFRFMAQMTNFMKEEDLVKERKRFSEQNLQKGDGFLLWPNTYKDIKQIDSKPFVIDDKQMSIIQDNVFNYFGVNKDILQNMAYGDKWAAFYEGSIEPFAIQFSEVVTKMLFTQREQSQGNGMMLTANRLQYMTANEKLNVSTQLADRGILNRDEIREIWNLPPLPNGEGQAYIIRGEYWDANAKLNDNGQAEDNN